MVLQERDAEPPIRHRGPLRPRDKTRGIQFSIAGLLLNAMLAMVKLISGILGNSYALVADAIESMADVFASVVVWRGLTVAALPPDEDHPYGHGKAEALAAAIVAIMLFGAAIGIAIEAIREIATPHHAPAPFTLIVLIAVVVVKEAMYRIGRRVGNETESSAVRADAWHHRSDAITSTAAFIGIAIALIGGKGYEEADDWAAMFAAGVIFVNAYRLVWPEFHVLMDRVSPDIVGSARRAAMTVAGVRAVEKVFARRSGAQSWVDMHIEVDPDLTVRDAHALVHAVKDAVRESSPTVDDVMIHVEPHDAGHQQPRS